MMRRYEPKLRTGEVSKRDLRKKKLAAKGRLRLAAVACAAERLVDYMLDEASLLITRPIRVTSTDGRGREVRVVVTVTRREPEAAQ